MATLVPTKWRVNANGFQIDMNIDSINDINGQVSGSMKDHAHGTLPLLNALWEEGPRRLTFTRTLPNGERQTFTGFLFDIGGVASEAAIAGTFGGDRFEDPGRQTFGWFALGVAILI